MHLVFDSEKLKAKGIKLQYGHMPNGIRVDLCFDPEQDGFPILSKDALDYLLNHLPDSVAEHVADDIHFEFEKAVIFAIVKNDSL